MYILFVFCCFVADLLFPLLPAIDPSECGTCCTRGFISFTFGGGPCEVGDNDLGLWNPELLWGETASVPPIGGSSGFDIFNTSVGGFLGGIGSGLGVRLTGLESNISSLPKDEE